MKNFRYDMMILRGYVELLLNDLYDLRRDFLRGNISFIVSRLHSTIGSCLVDFGWMSKNTFEHTSDYLRLLAYRRMYRKQR